jgi:hypothetical protein
MGFYLIGPLVTLISLGSISSWAFKPYCDDGLLGISPTQAAKIDQTTLEVPEQKCTSTALDPSPAVKKVCLGLPGTSKEVVIGANLDPK